ncbi:MAG: hypothetical protein IK062_03055 [Selenomonadaceae bacterium]|nr:hypothetical protein [Selenomonadaceae bacterium]
MTYSIKITSEDGEVIEIGNDSSDETGLITDVKIHLDTVKNDVSEKAMGMLAKITVKGIISNEESIKKKYIDLFNWSKSLSKNQWYRTILIKSYIDEDHEDVYRTYQFDNVFVVDYIEEYSATTKEADGKDHFELYLTQKENNLKSIETY